MQYLHSGPIGSLPQALEQISYTTISTVAAPLFQLRQSLPEYGIFAANFRSVVSRRIMTCPFCTKRAATWAMWFLAESEFLNHDQKIVVSVIHKFQGAYYFELRWK